MVTSRERIGGVVEVFSTNTITTAVILNQSGSVLVGEYVLSSGLRSAVKVDFDYLFNDPELFKAVSGMTIDLVKKLQESPQVALNFDAVVGVISGGKPFAKAIGEHFGKPWAAELGKNEGENEIRQIEGNIKPNSRLLIVEDAFTLGTNIKRTIERIMKRFPNEKDRPEIAGIVCVFTHDLVDSVKVEIDSPGRQVHMPFPIPVYAVTGSKALSQVIGNSAQKYEKWREEAKKLAKEGIIGR